MCRLDRVVIFGCVCSIVHAIPVQRRQILNPLDSLNSVASEIFGVATALAGPKPSVNTATASTTPSAETPPPSTANTQTSTLQSSIQPLGPSTTATAQTVSVPLSGTATQVSTGPDGISASSSGFLASAATDSAGLVATSSGSSGTAVSIVSIVPTTTSNSSPASSSSSPGSGSDSGSGSGSGSGSSTDSSPTDSQTSGGLSPAETAVTVIFPVLALIGIAFFLWRYCPPLRRRYTDWRQQRLEHRAYRRALDDPVLSFGVREKGLGLGMGDVEQLMRPLSFGFQTPQRQGIRRKPLNWDAGRVGADGISAIGMAVPMGEHSRTGSQSSEESHATRYEDGRLDET
ncbi:hypothetical protein A1O3_01363 [Capronia epimyces CBS 606.96]|uniref:Uncharacterized protein n=1 Tax=Capronia epimyces CBS 606.96 TaxID=1182542 RepID=W9ZE67_9EURO|nr:uncharacterized protein A1O3_01363 [Capronia epimyces CBS 606.96]EXJ92809.1 hypothetical protein A1O3_01363 [Capronia epimyces CBS 606.96]